VFVMVSELLESAEEQKRGETVWRRILSGFGEMDMKRNEGHLFHLHCSTHMRHEGGE